MNTFTIEKLLEWGYKEYKSEFSKADRKFQKIIWNSSGKKKYFINVEYWNFEKYSTQYGKVRDGFSSEVHFFLEDGHQFIVKYDIDLEKTLVGEMEEFYESIYKVMCCIPNIHNN